LISFFSLLPDHFNWEQFRIEFGSHLGPFDEEQFAFYKLFLIPAIKYRRVDFLEEEMFQYFLDERDNVEDKTLQAAMDALIIPAQKILDEHLAEEEYSDEEY